MAREKYRTLTEQMFYILLCLRRECCGIDIMEMVRTLTKERVVIGPGTLYTLLDGFHRDGLICQTKAEGRKRSYIITEAGQQLLDEELARLEALIQDYRSALKGVEEDAKEV